jgi:phosphinothricin acetyltransferase
VAIFIAGAGPVSATIRLATPADAEAIREIYNYYVERSTCTFQLAPDTAEQRLTWLQDRAAVHPVTVAELDGVVIGWGSLSPWKEREAYARTVEGSIYIHHDHLRRGLGKVLLLDLIERARALGHHTLIGGACTEQAASLALQKSLGFTEVAHFREVGNKFGRWLDVAYMQLMLT